MKKVMVLESLVVLALVISISSVVLAPEAYPEKLAFSKGRPANLQCHLYNLVKSYGESCFLSKPGEAGIRASRDRITVEILSYPDLDLNSILGVPGLIFEGCFMDLIQISVPVEGLMRLADISGVRFVRLPVEHYPLTISEGISVVGANKWHDAGYKGKGIKIAVIDLGFDGYENLLGTELPREVVAKSFFGSRTGNGDITGRGQNHGTACAEVVYDMVPEAEMYLVNFNTTTEERYAIEPLP